MNEPYAREYQLVFKTIVMSGEHIADTTTGTDELFIVRVACMGQSSLLQALFFTARTKYE